MLASPRDSCAGYGEGWAGWGALGSSLPGGWQGSPSILLGGVPWALPASPGMGLSHPGCFFFMCFEDHFCIVRSEEKKYSDMVEKRYLHTLVGRKGEGQRSRWGRGGGVGASQVPPTHIRLCGRIWGKEPLAEAQL